jgi:hypothetical protein
MSQSTDTVITMTAKAAPPIAVVTAQVAGMTVADWVQVATLIYVILMASHKAWQMYKEWRDDPSAPGHGK